VHLAIYCPFVVSLLLGAVAPGLARRLPPATAARLLTAGGVTAAVATSVSLAVLAATLAGDVPAVAALAGFRPRVLAASNPVPGPVATAAAAASGVLLLTAARLVVARLRALLAARALCRDLGGEPGALVVVDGDVQAVAVPTAGGRILASRDQLAALPAAERRALLLHESAHLRQWHHLYRLAADLAVAVDPLQFPVRGAVLYATERWADETAAAGVGDRAVVARVLAREALRAAGTRPRPGWSAVAMGSGGARVVPRVRALLDPAPRQRPGLVLAAVGLVAVAVFTALHAQADGDAWFDRAAHGQAGTSAHLGGCSPAHAPCGLDRPVGSTAPTGE
jgi:hypothetical protein